VAQGASLLGKKFAVINCGSRGRWRSLVAHLHDTQGVTGSSPVRPTIANPLELSMNPTLCAPTKDSDLLFGRGFCQFVRFQGSHPGPCGSMECDSLTIGLPSQELNIRLGEEVCAPWEVAARNNGVSAKSAEIDLTNAGRAEDRKLKWSESL
jgi:hypothetical protein